MEHAYLPEPEFVQMVRGHLKYLKPDVELSMDAELKSLGLDSMAAVDLLFDIEDNYGVTLPDRYLTEQTFSTTQALWNVVEDLRSTVEAEG